MKKLNIKIVPSAWLEAEGRRLDCGPYLSGAIEAKVLLEKLTVPKEPLHTLTSGHDGGIYNGPHFERNYVGDREHGVPFLGSSSMLWADFSTLPLLSKRDALSPKLSYLRLKANMILVSCSGTVGRMAFTRPDMDRLWTSQHVMKIVPDESRIPPGYLYAFLASRYGLPIIVGGTYGTIIQHIEPGHLRNQNVPVPRFGSDVETQADALMREATTLRCRYQEQIRQATSLLFGAVGLSDIAATDWHTKNPDLGFARRLGTAASLRALNFNPRFDELCTLIRSRPSRPLGELCKPGTLRRSGRYKRIDAEPEFAYQLIGQKEIFWLRPEGRWIAKRSVGEDVLVEPGTTLVAARGTLGESELYCRSEFVWGPLVERAYSEDFLRVVSDEALMPRGCLFAFMRSESAFRLLRSTSMGTKLQDHHPTFLRQLPVPYPEKRIQEEIHNLVVDAYERRYRSVSLEDEAISLVERAVEEGG